MKKAKKIKAWAMFGPGEKPVYRNTIASSKKDSLFIFMSKNTEHIHWKYWYQKGYRIRRITITVED